MLFPMDNCYNIFIDIIYPDYANVFDKVSPTKVLVKLYKNPYFWKYFILDQKFSFY